MSLSQYRIARPDPLRPTPRNVAVAALFGYYMKLHVILLLAYMALCRIKAVEQLQYEKPGELTKRESPLCVLGVNRLPLDRLRNKTDAIFAREDLESKRQSVLPILFV
jgi:hypothetical protein